MMLPAQWPGARVEEAPRHVVAAVVSQPSSVRLQPAQTFCAHNFGSPIAQVCLGRVLRPKQKGGFCQECYFHLHATS